MRAVRSALVGIDEATVDVRGQVEVDVAPAVNALEDAGRAADSTRPKLSPGGTPRVDERPAVSALARVEQAADRALHKLVSIGKTAIKWGGAALLAGSVAASVAVVKLGADMEQTRLSFQTMMGDVRQGNAVLAELAQFANVTPFSTGEVVDAGKTLMAFGVEAQDLLGILRQVGDVSAGTGKPLGELSQIVGKVMAKGRADTQTLNQMVEAGIPIIKTLAGQYGVSGEEIYKMAERGQLTAATVNSAFASMAGEGGIFADMMAKQSQTVAGKWSTVVGKLQLTAATIGEQVSPALQAGLDLILEWVDRLGEIAASGDAVDWLVEFGLKGVDVFGTVLVWANRFYQGALFVFRSLRSYTTMAFEAIQYAVAGVFVRIVGIASRALDGVVAAVNRARAIVGREPIEVSFDADLTAIEHWRDASRRNMQAAANDLARGNLDQFEAADRAMADRVDAARDAIRRRAEDFREALREGVAERAGGEIDAAGAAPAQFPAPEIAEPEPVKIRSEAQPPNLDALTRIGLYNFKIPLAALGDPKNLPGGIAGPPSPAQNQKSEIVNPQSPPLDLERNKLLAAILAAVSAPQQPIYRLA